MNTTLKDRLEQLPHGRRQVEGLVLLGGIVALMWIVEVINSLDSGGLDSDGIYARSLDRFWGILTSPFIHYSWTHLEGNTVPFLFLGAIIALRGAARLALVTGFVILVGGLGTWLIGPANESTIGASGVVFGYATYLLTRGFFDRNVLELLIGVVVGVVWGAILVAALIPQPHVSWQAHLCGGIAGILIAWRLSTQDRKRRGGLGRSDGGRPQGRQDPPTHEDALDAVLRYR
jgi:membrane associated rhomboid family serine protease